MTLNIAGNINKTNLEDKYYSESMGLGLQVSIPLGGGSSDQKSSTPSSPTPSSNNSTDPQSPAQGSPKGSETITANYSQNEASRTVYATIGGLNSTLVSETKTMIGADFEGTLTIDNRLFSDGGRGEIGKDIRELGANLNKNPLTPMGLSILLENYTGQPLTWEKGTETTFKEKGREFETAKVGANTVGKANVIITDPNDKNYKPKRLWLIGQSLSADPKGYKSEWQNEGGAISGANALNGMNAMSVFHDKFTQYTFLGTEGLLELSILPSIPITYYGLIGKSIRNLYEKPKK